MKLTNSTALATTFVILASTMSSITAIGIGPSRGSIPGFYAKQVECEVACTETAAHSCDPDNVWYEHGRTTNVNPMTIKKVDLRTFEVKGFRESCKMSGYISELNQLFFQVTAPDGISPVTGNYRVGIIKATGAIDYFHLDSHYRCTTFPGSYKHYSDFKGAVLQENFNE
jgi:hypothetical protein